MIIQVNFSSTFMLNCCKKLFQLMSEDETLVCDQSNESYSKGGTVYYAVQGGPNFSVCE